MFTLENKIQSYQRASYIFVLMSFRITMPCAWQHSSAQDTNLHMLENEVLCDITFLVGEEKEAIKCHKYMLVSRSPVFYTMFCGALAETSETVTIPDTEPTIWKLFLRY